MKLVYEAIFTPFENGEGYTVEVPDLHAQVFHLLSLFPKDHLQIFLY